jgi:urea carboxylase
VAVAVGSRVEAGQALVVLESMKMEITIAAPCAGKVTRLLCRPGSPVAAGARLMVIDSSAI